MLMKKTLLTFLLLLGTSFWVRSQTLQGCAIGCDTLVYDSKFNTQDDKWKTVPMIPIPAAPACSPGNGDRWEWGTTSRTSSSTCDGVYSPHPLITGQTKFWITELNGCFCNSVPGQPGGKDSMFIYKIMDLSSVVRPIRVEMTNWQDGCGPDRLAVYVNDTRIWDNQTGFPQPDNAAAFYNTIITHPALDAAAGSRKAVVAIVFFMTQTCNREGGVIANFDIRACKAACAQVPTLSEWALLALAILFLNISLVFRFRQNEHVRVKNN